MRQWMASGERASTGQPCSSTAKSTRLPNGKPARRWCALDMTVHRWAKRACSIRFRTATAGEGRSWRAVADCTPPDSGVRRSPPLVTPASPRSGSIRSAASGGCEAKLRSDFCSGKAPPAASRGASTCVYRTLAASARAVAEGGRSGGGSCDALGKRSVAAPCTHGSHAPTSAAEEQHGQARGVV